MLSRGKIRGKNEAAICVTDDPAARRDTYSSFPTTVQFPRSRARFLPVSPVLGLPLSFSFSLSRARLRPAEIGCEAKQGDTLCVVDEACDR